jgi:zinc transporter, ZIP family
MTYAHAILNAFLLSLLAGMGTGLGGLIAIFSRPGKRTFGFLMGITAGVMLTLAFHELVNEAWELQGFVTATIGFAVGATFMLVLDILIPHIRFGERETTLFERTVVQEINQESSFWRRHRHRHNYHGGRVVDQKLLNTGTLLSIGITIHNIPEGIAVGAGYMHFPEFGIFIAMAILLHNIPEGIATALPLYKSGLSRWNSFKVALFSGFAEPFGALIAVFFLSSFSFFVPGALAFAGGVMVFITLDELLPAAREHGHQHYTAVGIILGAIFVFLLSGLFGM